MPTGKKLEGCMITREQWLLREMRIVANLRLNGMSAEDVIEKAKAENIFQYRTERSLGSIARTCNKRIAAVDSEAIVGIVANGLPDAAAQANLYMMMCAYQIVRNFMLTEIARRYAELDFLFTKSDMNAYFTRLEAEYDNMAASPESTTVKLKQVLKKCLVECGMLSGPRSEELIPIYIDPDVKDAIKAKGDFVALTAFNCREAM